MNIFKQIMGLMLIGAWLTATSVAFANPEGGTVAAGTATIASSGPKLDVFQQTDKTVIDWRSFDIQAGEHTEFHQPSNNALALNRVNSTDPSRISGTLSANGNVMVVNPNGVFIGKDAHIDVNGLVATTANISNENFMAGNFRFDQPGNPDASIINEGTITAKEAGLVGLVAPNVENHGVINAKLGRVELASGDTMTLDMYGSDLYGIKVSDAVKKQIVSNTGVINAEGGTIAISAASGNQIVNSLVTIKGELNAPVMQNRGGKIIITAAGSNAVANNVTANKGLKTGRSTVIVAGKLDASGKNSGDKGGMIDVTADDVTLTSSSVLDTSGDAGGGLMRIGGGVHGQGLPAAATVNLEGGAYLDASAITAGKGGTIVTWADQSNTSAGTLLARGGALGGDGGFIETSARGTVNFGTLRVDASSPLGASGLWLIDPQDLTIDVTGAANIATTLNGGTSVTATTSACNASYGVCSGTTGNITLSSDIAKTAGGNATLTLTADNNIILNAAISSSTGQLAVTLNATGNISGNSSGTINTNGGLLTVNTASGSGTLAGVISGTGGITKTGAGTLILSGNNTYTGATAVNAGTLSANIDNTPANGISTSAVSVADGATLQITIGAGNPTVANAISGTSLSTLALTMNNSAVFSNLTGFNGVVAVTGTGRLNVTSNIPGSMTIANGSQLWVNNSITIGGITANGVGSGGFGAIRIDNSATLTSDIIMAGATTIGGNAGNGSGTINGVISGAYQLTKGGNNIVTLSGANTYSGGTVVSNGTLRLGNPLALGVSSGTVSVANGKALDLNGQTITNTNPLTLNGGTGAVLNSSGTGASYAGLITLAAASGISAGSGSITFTNTGTISGAGFGLTLGGNGGGSIASIIGTGSGNLTVTAGTWTLTGINTYTGGTNINGGTLRFASGALGSSGNIIFAGGTLQYTAGNTQDISARIKSSTSSITIDPVNNNITYAGIIDSSNSGGLTLNDSGSGSLNVSGANTYTGGTTISAGTLQTGSATALGANASIVSVALGAVLDLNGTTMTNTNPLTLNGTGISSGGALINSSVTGATYAGLVTLGSASSIVGGTGTIALSNAGTITGSGFGLTLGGNAGGSIASIIGTGAGNVTKTGSGTWTLSGANTYTGATSITGGTLSASNIVVSAGNSNLGNAASAVTISGGGILSYTGATATYTRGFTINSGIGEVDNVGAGILTIATGGIVTTGGTFVVGGAGDTTVSSVISGTGGVTKTGAGNLIISGANTYTGATTISSGTVKAGAANVLGGSSSTSALVMGGGTLDLNGFAQAVGSLTGTGSITSTAAGTFGLTAGYDNTSPAAYSGTILIGSSTALSLTKAGTGTLILSGANTYSGGTTISAGTLQIGSAAALGAASGVVSVASGAVLDLNGFTITNTNPLTLNGTGISSGGALINSSATGATYAGLLTLGSASSIVGGAGTIALSNAGTITGSGFGLTLGGSAGGSIASIIGTATGSLTKSGSGTWTLSGANTFSGGTTINAGILVGQSSANAFGSGTIKLGSGLADGISATLYAGGTTSGLTYANAILLASGSTGTLTIGETDAVSSATFSGNITGTNNLVLANNNSSTGKLTLSGSINPIGTITNSGTAITGNIASTAITIPNGAVVLTGTIGTNVTSVTQNGTSDLIISGNNSSSNFTTTIINGRIDAGNYTNSTAAPFSAANGVSIAASAGKTAILNFGARLGGGFGGSPTIAGPISVSGAGTNYITVTDNNPTYSGALNLAANLTIVSLNVGGSSQTFTGGVTGTGNIAIYNDNVTTNSSPVRFTTSPVNIFGSITYSNAAFAALGGTAGTNTAANTITGGVGANVTAIINNNTTNPLTISGSGFALNNSGTTLTNAAGATVVTISSAISGTGGLTVNNSSSNPLILSGANTYTGGTTISAGTLQTGSATALGANASIVSVALGAVLDLNGTTMTNINPLTLNGTGISSGGALINSSVTGATYAGLVTLGSASSIVGGTGTIALSNAGTITGAGFGLTLGGNAGGSIASIIGTGAGSVTKTGSGTWTLSGANTYTGGTTISAGTLQTGSATALGANASIVSVALGAVLDLNGTTMTNTNPLTLNGTGISSGGALINSSVTGATYAGLVTLGSASSIVGGTGTIALSNAGTITGSGFGLTLGGNAGGSIASIIGTGAGNVTKTGSGTWTLSGANTYTGGITVNGGTLSVATIGNGGVASNLGASASTATNLVLAGGTLKYTGVTASSDRDFTLAAGTTNTIDVATGATLTLSGASTNTTGALTKIGSGTLLLSGNNLYTGATSINAGTLSLGSAGGLSSSTIVTVAAGSTFNLASYSPTLGGITNNGTLAFGSNNTLTTSGNQTHNGTITGTNIGLVTSGAGAFSFNNPTSLFYTVTTAGGDIVFNNAVTLNGNSTLNTGAGSVTFASTIDSTAGNYYTLTSSGSGANSFAGAVGSTNPLGAVNITGTTTLNGNVTTNNANIGFTGAVTLGANNVLSAGSGTINLGSTLNGNYNFTASAGTFNLSGALGGSARLGDVSLTSANALSLPAITAATIFARSTASTSNLTLNGNLDANSVTATPVTLVAGQNFLNTGNYNINVGANRWLIYSTNRTGTNQGTLSEAFRRYSCTYGGSCPVLASGNGMLFSYTPLLTITPDAYTNLIYGDAVPTFASHTYTLSNYLSGDSSTTNIIAGTASYSTNYTQFANTGNYNITSVVGALTSTQGYGFQAATRSNAFSIIPKAATITANAQSITYGDGNIYNGFTTSGFVNGQIVGSVTFATDATASSSGNWNQGSWTITPSAATGGTFTASNYSLTYYTGTLSVARKALTVTPTLGQSKIYGDVDPTLTYSTTGLVAGDTVSGALARSAGENVATYAITQGNLANGNYNISFTNGRTFAINQRPLIIQASDQTHTYGFGNTSADLGTSGYSLAGGTSLVGSDTLSGVTLATDATLSGAGKYTSNTTPWRLYVTNFAFSSGSASNYAISYVDAPNGLTIQRAALTLQGLTVSDKTYDGNRVATVSPSGLSGLLSGDNVTLGALSAVFASKNVGTQTVAISSATLLGNDKDNYTAIDGNNTTARINARDLSVQSITASDKVYDGTTTSILTGYTLNNVVADDNISLGSYTASFDSKNVGMRTVALNGATLTGADAGNYNFKLTKQTTTANITPRPLTVAAFMVADKKYDGNTSAVVTKYNFDDALDTLTINGIKAVFDNPVEGKNKVARLIAGTLYGDESSNYAFRLGNTFALATITGASAEIPNQFIQVENNIQSLSNLNFELFRPKDYDVTERNTSFYNKAIWLKQQNDLFDIFFKKEFLNDDVRLFDEDVRRLGTNLY